MQSAVVLSLLAVVSAQHGGGGGGSCEAAAPLTGQDIALRVIGSIVLLLLSALFSGLTLGLLGLDPNQLQIIKEAGSPADRAYAEIIEPVRKQGNRLLTTLVLGNVAVISLQSIAMADLTSGLVGFLLSTALTVVFGEIVPQAICARYALYIGAKTVPIIRVIMFLLYPVAAPLAYILDKAMGEEIGTYYTKSEFLKLVKMHLEQNTLDAREAGIIGGAITYKDKKVKAVMTPVSRMFALTERDRLDYDTMELVFRTGYSRVPVWNEGRTAIVGLLLAKDLLLVSPAQAHPVAAVLAFFQRTHVSTVDDEDTLETTLKTFMSSKSHFAIVRTVDASGSGDPVYRIAGLVTLEDVLEEILGDEISDEYDTARAVVTVGDGSSASGTAGHHGGGVPQPSAASAREAVLRAAYTAAHPETTGRGGGGGAVAPNGMTEAEVRAVSAHLCANCPPFVGRFTLEDVCELVRGSAVVDAVSRLPDVSPTAEGGTPLSPHAFTPAHPGGADLLHPLRVLYTRGARDACAAYCTVVLQGEVQVEAGADGILALSGPWDILAHKSLTHDEYAPDFSAVPRTSVARVLRIHTLAFRALAQGGRGVQGGGGKAAGGGAGGAADHVAVHLVEEGEGGEGGGGRLVRPTWPGESAYGSLASPTGLSPTILLPTRQGAGGGGTPPKTPPTQETRGACRARCSTRAATASPRRSGDEPTPGGHAGRGGQIAT